MDRTWQSTGPLAHGASMTTTPFDDPIAFDRRWSRFDPMAPAALADADPLMFLADHLPIADRRGGVGICDTDRRWALALRAVCDAFSIEPLGVMARLRSGALVRVPLPKVLPGDYIDGLTV